MAGLDIYRLAQGTTLAIARDPNNNNATFMQYTPGGQDFLIGIKPGYAGFSTLLCGTFNLWTLAMTSMTADLTSGAIVDIRNGNARTKARISFSSLGPCLHQFIEGIM